MYLFKQLQDVITSADSVIRLLRCQWNNSQIYVYYWFVTNHTQTQNVNGVHTFRGIRYLTWHTCSELNILLPRTTCSFFSWSPGIGEIFMSKFQFENLRGSLMSDECHSWSLQYIHVWVARLFQAIINIFWACIGWKWTENRYINLKSKHTHIYVYIYIYINEVFIYCTLYLQTCPYAMHFLKWFLCIKWIIELPNVYFWIKDIKWLTNWQAMK